MEVSDVRRRLRTAIDESKRRADERRAKKDAAAREWERVLADVAVPLFHQLASALNAEGHRFQVVTPGTAVRLVPERGGEEFVELALDTDGDEPAVMISSTRGRGRRTVSAERVLRSGADLASFTDEDMIAALVEALVALIER